MSIDYFIPQMYISLTNICNFKCVFCGHQRSTSTPKTLSNDDFRKIIKKLKAYGILKLTLTPMHGEIFVDKYIIDKFKILEEENMYFSFFTNASLIQTDHLEHLKNNKNFRCLSISFYGMNVDDFINITQKPEYIYYQTIDNIKNIYSILGLEKVFIFNLRTLENIKKEKSLSLYYLNNKNIFDINVFSLISKTLSYEVLFNYYNFNTINIENEKICFNKILKPIVLPNGNISLCSRYDINEDLIVGNIYENDLSDILTMRNEKFRHHMYNNVGICKTCTLYPSYTKGTFRFRFPRVDFDKMNEFVDFFNINIYEKFNNDD